MPDMANSEVLSVFIDAAKAHQRYGGFRGFIDLPNTLRQHTIKPT
jgi:hypothetical protein